MYPQWATVHKGQILDTPERLSIAHRKGTTLEVGKIKGSILSYYRGMTLERDWEEELT